MTAGPHLDPNSLTGSGAESSGGAAEHGLDEARQRFVSLWSRMASTWGISRTMAEVHAWLFITGGPRHAEEVMEALQISRGNASMTLRRLEEWELVTRVHRRGDRKEYFEAEQDVWRMFRTILAQRKKRELDPLLEELDACRSAGTGLEGGPGAGAETDAGDTAVHDQRIDDLAGFLAIVDAIAGRVLSEDAEGTSAADLLGRVTGSPRGEDAQ